MNDWWLYIWTPDRGLHLYHFGIVADETISQWVPIARAEQNVPEEWLAVPGWQVSLSMGDPYPPLLVDATVHDWTSGPPAQQ